MKVSVICPRHQCGSMGSYDIEPGRLTTVNCIGCTKEFTIKIDKPMVSCANVLNQNRYPTNEQGGIKYDQDKPDWSLIPMDLLQEVVEVFTFGADKYGRENWHKVETLRYFSAALRHIISFRMGEEKDEESGIHHLAHAITCLFFIWWHAKKKKDDPIAKHEYHTRCGLLYHDGKIIYSPQSDDVAKLFGFQHSGQFIKHLEGIDGRQDTDDKC